MEKLYSPNGKDHILAHPDQVEYLKTKGWTDGKPQSVSKKTKKIEE